MWQHRSVLLPSFTLAWCLSLVASHGIVFADSNFRPHPIPDSLRSEFQLAPFYTKCIVLEGFPIVSSHQVSDMALSEAAWTVSMMLKNRSDVFHQLAKNKIRLSVMSVDERTCDIPEHSDLTPVSYWNKRARGLGATRARPSVSCAEENLLHHPGDPYATESILIHEFAHAIHLMAINDLDPSFDKRLKEAYRSALSQGRWQKAYAAENAGEYWAEGVQCWFDANAKNNSNHIHVATREQLEQYDPELAALCLEVFHEQNWKYVRADSPDRTEPFLKGLQRENLKPFRWTTEEKKD